MSFRFSPGGRGAVDPWFRVGTVDISTTTLVVAVGTIAMIVDAFLGFALSRGTLLLPAAVFDLQVWRLVTWPLANQVGLWTVVTLFMLWYFGNDLESSIGRSKMVSLLVGFAVVLTVVETTFGLVAPYAFGLAGLAVVEFMVLLTWIGEYPHRRFLFNIPAWVFGLIIVGLQMLQLIASRSPLALLSLVVEIALCALVARSVGLLSEQTWLPALKRRPRKQRRRFDGARPTVVSGPWDSHPAAGSSSPRSRDDARLDELLDKISEVGMDGLSEKERRELQELRARRAR